MNKLKTWIELRKNTTPVHWLYGGLCAFLILANGIVLGWLAMGAFAVLEHWNDKEEKAKDPAYIPTGCTDWWESFIVFMPGHGVISLLSYLGIIAIRWC